MITKEDRKNLKRWVKAQDDISKAHRAFNKAKENLVKAEMKYDSEWVWWHK